MITEIDMKQFGCFADFVWADQLKDGNGEVKGFKKLNILYGRNYSGKTTFSRVVRALETGRLPPKFDSPDFTVKTTTGDISPQQIPATNHTIRVYNKDFVDENLRFLRDENGDIEPFAIVGGQNTEATTQIATLTEQLGSAEDEKGLKFEVAKATADLKRHEDAYKEAAKDLDTKLKRKATQKPSGIKYQTKYEQPNYNITKIKADIVKIHEQEIKSLDELTTDKLEALLTESSLPDVNAVTIAVNYSELRETARELVERAISPSDPINELLQASVLQTWVRNGMPLHRDCRDTCGFCGGQLPTELWAKLDAHFSEESERLTKELAKAIESIDAELRAVESVALPSATGVYSEFKTPFDSACEDLKAEFMNYASVLKELKAALEAKASDIFGSHETPDVTFDPDGLNNRVKAVNTVIEQNNAQTSELDDKKAAAREQLRHSEVAAFLVEIDYDSECAKIEELSARTAPASEEVERLKGAHRSC